MKYQANPVIVTAHAITSVAPTDSGGGCTLYLSNGETAYATRGMLARMAPVIGDYWVVQDDGYQYLNPKAVFERKYSEVKP